MTKQLMNSLFFSHTEHFKYLTQASGVNGECLFLTNITYKCHNMENGMHKVFGLHPIAAISH